MFQLASAAADRAQLLERLSQNEKEVGAYRSHIADLETVRLLPSCFETVSGVSKRDSGLRGHFISSILLTHFCCSSVSCSNSSTVRCGRCSTTTSCGRCRSA